MLRLIWKRTKPTKPVSEAKAKPERARGCQRLPISLKALTSATNHRLWSSTRHGLESVVTTGKELKKLFELEEVIYIVQISIYRIFAIFPNSTLQLALELGSIILLDQNVTIWIWVNGKTIERVQLARSVEHVFIDFSILATQR